MESLDQLHQTIDARTVSIRSAVPEWLCGKGCDQCCHRLADVPQLTAAEWQLLVAGLAALEPTRLRQISQKIQALAEDKTRPVICPMLDLATGACPVYAQRPVACRTYGFYVQRELGLYCTAISSQVAEDALQDVIWGNQDAVDQALKHLGQVRPLTAWFEDSKLADGII